MKTSEVLIQAKALIATPEQWTQGDYEKVVNGKPCYCSLGAIGQVSFSNPDSGVTWYGEVGGTQAAKLLRQVVLHDLPPDHTFAPYNDSHTHAEVMEAFNKAIYLAHVEEGEVVKL